MNDIYVVGVNHRIAPVEVRERLAFNPQHIPAALHELSAALETQCPGVARKAQVEAVILSTCNRTEIYVCADGAADAEIAVRRFLADYGQFPPEALNAVLYTYRGNEAGHHLLQVAAGLDSLVIGESEILGQVKDACEIAHTAGTTGPILAALFRRAIQAGKRVRTETDIGQVALSAATIVVELAGEMCGSLADCTALLIGAGKMSSLAARALVKAGLRCVLVANRTYQRAQKLAQSLGGRAVRFDALAENLVEADIVVCSTGAPHIVLHVEDVRTAMGARPDRPLLVVDLAVPRDADPAIGDLPGVRLADIDDLDALVQANHPLAVAVRQAAEAIVDGELSDFRAWYDARLCVPVIRALRAKADAICRAELERTLRRLGDLTPQQQRAVEAMGQAIVGKLLHEPITHLKEPPPGVSRDECVGLTQKLFGVTLDAA
jgi:glutamyl-tRNA reductase